MGLSRAGFDVTGVDIIPQPRYPFRFIHGDALAQDLTGYDFVWASPPCQAHSTMKCMPNARKHLDLIPATRSKLIEWGGPWIIENVVGAPLRNPAMLCGSMFGLNDGIHELRRHRLFESNMMLMFPPCQHRFDVIGFYGDHCRTRQITVSGNRHRGGDITGNQRKLALGKTLMGIDWMTWDELCLAIPPAYSEFLGKQVVAILQKGW